VLLCTHYFILLDCGRFSVANGEVNTSLGTSIGSLATVKCDDGYDLQGSSAIICTSDGWDKTVSCQIQGILAYTCNKRRFLNIVFLILYCCN
jgi:hypothetical protein